MPVCAGKVRSCHPVAMSSALGGCQALCDVGLTNHARSTCLCKARDRTAPQPLSWWDSGGSGWFLPGSWTAGAAVSPSITGTGGICAGHRNVCEKPCRRPSPPTSQHAEARLVARNALQCQESRAFRRRFLLKIPRIRLPDAAPAADLRRPFAALRGPEAARTPRNPALPARPRPLPRHWTEKFLAGGGLAEGRSGPRGPPMKGGGRCGAGPAGCGRCAGWS